MLPEYIRNEQDLKQVHEKLKLTLCPHCKKMGMLILHGYIKNNKNIIKAHRVFCSNRNNRTGCGKTFSIYYADYIKNISVASDILWKFLKYILHGLSIEIAYKELGDFVLLELRTFYRYWRAFKQKQFIIRSNIYTPSKSPPTNLYPSPYHETIAHLKRVCKKPDQCPVTEYQLIFQCSFL